MLGVMLSGVVLVVDDEPSVRRLTTRMLARLGFSTVEAADGTQTVELLRDRADELALVLLDLTVPGLDAEELLTQLERDGSQVPVVICSGYSAQELSARFAGRRVAGFLHKPFGLDGLQAAVLDALPAQ
jgi:CheY-like chemotaxis protein